MARRGTRTVAILALTQVLSWGALYYAFSVLAKDMQHELGWSQDLVYGAFSWCLLVAGLGATPVGILLDRHGGRWVMTIGSAVGAAGLALLAHAHTPLVYYGAWTIIGISMSLTLYDAAFATINHQFGAQSRRAISTLTLFGGLASTVSWPATLHIGAALGWRHTFLVYAGIQLLVCLPAHLALPPKPPQDMPRGGARHFTLNEALRDPTFWKLAFSFACNSFIFSAMTVHLIPLLHRMGHPLDTAVMLAAIIGPLQVAGRIAEMANAHRTRPQTVGIFTFAVLPVALLALALFGEQAWGVVLFCVFYGVSNGIITIVRGTVPLALFGSANYGAISGAMSGPALVARASGPLVLAALLPASGAGTYGVLVLLAAACFSLLLYLSAIRGHRHAH
ncbi:MFS transporter [Massilia sp. TS11]|uniref:MFS transporter n=1 Tax=Massilia sp. TS11 TaxID=2908003 RepID=UPI001EDAD7BA|nr:MFS transporter [Massilia sp. TS11]MCG2584920.1 MFS transporter [Massilia sp. TS11]